MADMEQSLVSEVSDRKLVEGALTNVGISQDEIEAARVQANADEAERRRLLGLTTNEGSTQSSSVKAASEQHALATETLDTGARVKLLDVALKRISALSPLYQDANASFGELITLSAQQPEKYDFINVPNSEEAKSRLVALLKTKFPAIELQLLSIVWGENTNNFGIYPGGEGDSEAYRSEHPADEKVEESLSKNGVEPGGEEDPDSYTMMHPIDAAVKQATPEQISTGRIEFSERKLSLLRKVLKQIDEKHPELHASGKFFELISATLDNEKHNFTGATDSTTTQSRLQSLLEATFPSIAGEIAGILQQFFPKVAIESISQPLIIGLTEQELAPEIIEQNGIRWILLKSDGYPTLKLNQLMAALTEVTDARPGIKEFVYRGPNGEFIAIYEVTAGQVEQIRKVIEDFNQREVETQVGAAAKTDDGSGEARQADEDSGIPDGEPVVVNLMPAAADETVKSVDHHVDSVIANSDSVVGHVSETEALGAHSEPPTENPKQPEKRKGLTLAKRAALLFASLSQIFMLGSAVAPAKSVDKEITGDQVATAAIPVRTALDRDFSPTETAGPDLQINNGVRKLVIDGDEIAIPPAIAEAKPSLTIEPTSNFPQPDAEVAQQSQKMDESLEKAIPTVETFNEIHPWNYFRNIVESADISAEMDVNQVVDPIKDVFNALNTYLNPDFDPDSVGRGSKIVYLPDRIENLEQLKEWASQIGDAAVMFTEEQVERFAPYVSSALTKKPEERSDEEKLIAENLNAHPQWGGDANAIFATEFVSEYPGELGQLLLILVGAQGTPTDRQVTEAMDTQHLEQQQEQQVVQEKLKEIAENTEKFGNLAPAVARVIENAGWNTPHIINAILDTESHPEWKNFPEKVHSLLASNQQKLEQTGVPTLFSPARDDLQAMADGSLSPATSEEARLLVQAIREESFDNFSDPDGVFGSLNRYRSYRNVESAEQYVGYFEQSHNPPATDNSSALEALISGYVNSGNRASLISDAEFVRALGFNPEINNLTDLLAKYNGGKGLADHILSLEESS